MRRFLIVLFMLRPEFVLAGGVQWIVTTYDDASGKERRFRLKPQSQLIPIDGYEWKCLAPQATSEVDSRLEIRSIQCSVLGSGRMVGGVATCVKGAQSQPGSLNLTLHEGLSTKSNRFEFATNHKSVAITLECSSDST